MNRRPWLQPLFLLILGLDQLLKGAALGVLPEGAQVELLPGLGYAFVHGAAGFATPERLRVAVIVLLGAWLLLRLGRRRAPAVLTTQTALPLLGAGLTSNLIDLILLRERVGLFTIALPGGELLLSLADVAVAAGGVLVITDLARGARAPRLHAAELERPRPLRLDLGVLPRGIDNLRVDVAISPTLRALIREIATAVLVPHVWTAPWRAHPYGHPYGANPARLAALRAGCQELLEGAAQRAREQGRTQLVALAQLALLACIRTETAAAFERLRRDLRLELEQRPRGAERGTARLQQQLASIGRRRNGLIEAARALLLEQVRRSQTGASRERHHALAGEAAGLDEELLANPLLPAPEPRDPEFLLRRYGLLLDQRAGDPAHPARIEALLREGLACARAAATATVGTAAEGDRRPEPCPWLDVPANLARLLDLEATMGEGARGHGGRDLRRRARAQRRLLDALEGRLRVAGLMPLVLAAEELAGLAREGELPMSPRLLRRYLTELGGRRTLAAHLGRLQRRGAASGATLDALETAAQRIRRAGPAERRLAVSRYARSFFRYRRDRKHLRAIEGWLGQIRLIDEPQTLRLARANRTLHAFPTTGDAPTAEDAPVRGHVIVKADVRGSTTMIAELCERGLNPATHFAAHFFEPIGALLPLYGARKVFVEGDAVILALLERGDAPAPCVARACGLARSILEVVGCHNARATRQGLPVLELGVGIAYEAGAPTWLYDEEHPIMISPAIGRADRLSSCAAFLRSEPHFAAGNRVQVFQAAIDAAGDDKKGSARFRYNVDGIELEAQAFERLRGELRLHTRARPCGPKGGIEHFHWGRFPDARGLVHRLVVREGRIWSFDRRKGPLVETDQAFYEVLVAGHSELRQWAAEAEQRDLPA